MPLSHAVSEDLPLFGFRLAAHSSPLNRDPKHPISPLQQGKEANVALAASKLDGLLIGPNQVFSHHHALGRPTRFRGFKKGLELRNEEPSGEIGGGLCQVSNSFFWVAVQAGMRIVERHRHGLDLFPDNERTVPFGCGATVVYNYADLRFKNPFPQPVMLRARVEGGFFVSEIWTVADPGVSIEVEETNHRFFQENGHWMRENRLVRRITVGESTSEEIVADNRGRVLYEPQQ